MGIHTTSVERAIYTYYIEIWQEKQTAILHSMFALVHGGGNSFVVYWVPPNRKEEDSVMRGPQPNPLSLTEVERNELERLVRCHSTAQQMALRGRIILEANAGKNNSQIARELGLSVETVRAWRKRWLALQPVTLADLSVQARLSDVPRPGRKSQITAEQTCLLIAMACEQPKERPISQWTGREIADEAMARGIVKQISPRHAARLLKKGISSRT